MDPINIYIYALASIIGMESMSIVSPPVQQHSGEVPETSAESIALLGVVAIGL